jgi:pyridoxine 5-phosphate synthase
MSIKLGVNIDHVATLRQARGIGEPDILEASEICCAAGADMIVCHLRKDRRHMQDKDLFAIKKTIKKPLHVEMACTPEMEKIALKLKPHSVCIVPESPNELTTEGGLKFSSTITPKIEKMTKKLLKAGIGVSLFINPDAHSIRTAKKCGARIVEFCTKSFAEAKTDKKQQDELGELNIACLLATELGLHVHAGHGLDYVSSIPVAQIKEMECLNIGFSIIARSLFIGLRKAVMDMKKIIN